MAKRKQNQLVLSADVVSRVGMTLMVLVALGLAILGGMSYVQRSPIFTITEISIPENLKSMDIPEIAKLKGQNIFKVDIARVEDRIHSKYPQLAHTRVVRRLPDTIDVSAFKRDGVAAVQMEGKFFLIDRDGFLIGAQPKDMEPVPVIKGVSRQKVVLGDLVADERVKAGLSIIQVFRGDGFLSKVPLKAVDISDMARIVCVLGEEGDQFEAIVDKDNFAHKASTLATLLSHNDIDLTKVKYIDLRFGEPIIGQKKTGGAQRPRGM